MVAKIYDPLYYSKYSEHRDRANVVYNADSDYSHEAVAFKKLQESAEARAVIPAYYGTWTVDVDTPIELPRGKKRLCTRPVRFILMERLCGELMANVNPRKFREDIRSMILRKAIAAGTLIYGAGVDHRDLSPRNIMVSGLQFDDHNTIMNESQIEVKVFDFNIATVLTHPQYCPSWSWQKPRKRQWPSKLRSPIMLYYGGQMTEFSAKGWCSSKDMDPERWLWREFRDDDRYVPVIWDPENPTKAPVYQEPPSVQPVSAIDAKAGISLDCSLTKENGSSGDGDQKPLEGKKDNDIGVTSTGQKPPVRGYE
jgi:hypothetical protein